MTDKRTSKDQEADGPFDDIREEIADLRASLRPSSGRRGEARPVVVSKPAAVGSIVSLLGVVVAVGGILRSHVARVEDKFDRFEHLPYQVERIADDLGVLRGYYDRYVGLDAEVKSFRAIQETVLHRLDKIEEKIDNGK